MHNRGIQQAEHEAESSFALQTIWGVICLRKQSANVGPTESFRRRKRMAASWHV